jgi:putative addiction module component (TIGR02574 family)
MKINCMTITQEDIKALTPDERQQLLSMLWDVIENDDYKDNLPEETEEELNILNERVEEYNRNPSSAMPFDEAIQKLRDKKR